MKTKLTLVAPALLALFTLNLQPATVRAQDTVFTYQGRVTDNGTNFSGTGQFEFALVTSTNVNHTATAAANPPSGGFITGYTLTFGGNGYVTAPAVTVFGGGGSGAAAHANISGGAVTSISVDNTGNGGYTNAPTVVIAPPTANFSFTTFWSNDGTSVNGSEPSSAVAVGVNNGLFTVVLGDATVPDMLAIPASLFATPNLQLRIWFNDGVNGSAVLSPVQNLTPTPYAAFANAVGGLAGGLIIQQNTNGAPNVIGGSSANFVSNTVVGATIAGGGEMNFSNSVTANFGTISGGGGNTAGGFGSTVGGGFGNTASSPDGSATVGGGYQNTASGDSSTVGGGLANTATGYSGATVAGGYGNTASGSDATVGGGSLNVASGDFSFAAGVDAQATNVGAFVWSDTQPSSFSSTANNQFSVRAAGGVRLVGYVSAGDISLSENGAYHHLEMSGGNSVGYLYGSFPSILGDGIHLGYNYFYDANGGGHVINTGGGTSRITAEYGEIVLAVGGVNVAPNTVRLDATTSGVTVYGTFNNSSDRNAKQDFAPIIASQMLEKVAQLPLSEWSYKDDPATRHVGPMGQDFYSTFNIGTDEKHIAPIDEGGVALAAIQGLNEKVESGKQKAETQMEELKTENAELKRQLNHLVQTVSTLNQEVNGGAK